MLDTVVLPAASTVLHDTHNEFASGLSIKRTRLRRFEEIRCHI